MSFLDFKIEAKGLTDVGRVRKGNQDSFLLDSNLKLYIVADGMGGHAGGEIASAICVETIYRCILREHLVWTFGPELQTQIFSSIEKAVQTSCLNIYDFSLANPELRGMGTTVTMMIIYQNRAFIGQVGDSRLYLMRCGCLYPITQDHSWISEQLKAGLISKEEAKSHKLRNIITRCVGFTESEWVDTYSLILEPRDSLLLCSDGLHSKLSDHEMGSLIKDHGLKSLEKLIEKANDRGGEDNITALLVEVFK